ncbi:beta-ketoacyl-ACP reductase [Allostella vacuolata]|nr:beta-ketoacyl-ACP reductase [Stella vacuolata]
MSEERAGGSLAGRTALVTGAAGGLGRATARRLASQGASLYLTDREPERVARAVEELAGEGHAVRGTAGDAVVSADVDRVVAEAREAFGRVDILVNIVGGSGPKSVREIDQIEDALWDLVIAINVRSTFLFSRAVVPLMREAGRGRIVNFSSIAAHGRKGPVTTQGCRLAYATGKAALLGLTSQLAKDVAQYGITVNAILPALILSGKGHRLTDRFEGLTERARELFLHEYPSGRIGTPEEVAATVAFLVSDEAGYISGARLTIDGGFL